MRSKRGSYLKRSLKRKFAMDDSFVFSDEKYSKDVLKRLSGLQKQGIMCDVTIKIEEEEFHAHRNILSACSDYFFAMFNGNMKERHEREISISGVDKESMKMIIGFIYTGEITLDWNNVEPVLQSANLMLVQSVKDACSRFLESRLDVKNCIGIQGLAEAYACHKLWTITNNFIFQNFSHVAESEEFMNLDEKQLEVLLQSDEISVESEEKVYEALLGWINYDPENRQEFFPSLMEYIRLPLVSPYYLVDVVESEELFNTSERCKELLLEAQHYHLLPDRRQLLDSSRTKPRNYERFQEILVAMGGNGDYHNQSTGRKKSLHKARLQGDFCGDF